MWFIIRAAFCVGVVFSMLPGDGATDGRGASSFSEALMTPLGRDLFDGALSICNRDPKFCFDMAHRLAELGPGAPTAAIVAAQSPQATRPVSDTLTAADRAIPWRAAAKKPRVPAHLRVASGQ
jgi:hypothetical protein